MLETFFLISVDVSCNYFVVVVVVVDFNARRVSIQDLNYQNELSGYISESIGPQANILILRLDWFLINHSIHLQADASVKIILYLSNANPDFMNLFFFFLLFPLYSLLAMSNYYTNRTLFLLEMVNLNVL